MTFSIEQIIGKTQNDNAETNRQATAQVQVRNVVVQTRCWWESESGWLLGLLQG